jgi:hypothetical protein
MVAGVRLEMRSLVREHELTRIGERGTAPSAPLRAASQARGRRAGPRHTPTAERVRATLCGPVQPPNHQKRHRQRLRREHARAERRAARGVSMHEHGAVGSTGAELRASVALYLTIPAPAGGAWRRGACTRPAARGSCRAPMSVARLRVELRRRATIRRAGTMKIWSARAAVRATAAEVGEAGVEWRRSARRSVRVRSTTPSAPRNTTASRPGKACRRAAATRSASKTVTIGGSPGNRCVASSSDTKSMRTCQHDGTRGMRRVAHAARRRPPLACARRSARARARVRARVRFGGRGVLAHRLLLDEADDGVAVACVERRRLECDESAMA